MQLVKTTLCALTALALVGGFAAAHARPYEAASEVLGICFTDGGLLQDVPSSGATCYNAGHVTTDASSGQATVTITDLVLNPVGGFACQDLNDDTWCGNDPLGVPGNELAQLFCGSTVITDTDHGGLYSLAADFWVFINGPVSGVFDQVNGGQCGAFSAGTTGSVDHAG